MRYCRRALLLMGLITGLVMALPSTLVAQEEVITLEGARIRGNQEAPLVLYLVPWQPPEARSLARPDEELMLARPMEPLERAEFRRLMGYHQHFQSLNRREAGPGNADSQPE